MVENLKINCLWHKDSIYAEPGDRLNIQNNKVQLIMWSKQENSRCQNSLRFKTRGNRIKFCCCAAQRLFNCSFFFFFHHSCLCCCTNNWIRLTFEICCKCPKYFQQICNQPTIFLVKCKSVFFFNGEKTEMLTFILETVKWNEVFRQLRVQTLKPVTLFFFLH